MPGGYLNVKKILIILIKTCKFDFLITISSHNTPRAFNVPSFNTGDPLIIFPVRISIRSPHCP